MLQLIAAGRSDVGLRREHNEDGLALLPRHGLFVVADGMGGHRAGEVASRLAIESLSAFFDSTARGDIARPQGHSPAPTGEEDRLVIGIKVASQAICEAGSRNREHRGMGTTVVAALFAPDRGRIHVGHVGDSRCYRIRNGTIEQLTRDHSLVNEYLRTMPGLTMEQRGKLPHNVITRALGMAGGVEVDVSTHDVLAGDRYVLCSDGLSGMVADEDIRKIVRDRDDPDRTCEDLIRKANERGGEDNITALVVHVVVRSPLPGRPGEENPDMAQTNNSRAGTVQKVYDDDFDRHVDDDALPVFVFFGASWCHWCTKYGPVVGSVARKYAGRAKFIKLDTGESPETARKYKVKGVPVMLMFWQGRPRERIEGFLSEEKLDGAVGGVVQGMP